MIDTKTANRFFHTCDNTSCVNPMHLFAGTHADTKPTETLYSMKVEKRIIETLQEDPRNARVHDSRNIGAICASLQQFGQQKPIVIKENGEVVAGSGTLRAARSMGWSHVAVVVTELDGVEAQAFGVADNRSAELATWNLEAVRAIEAAAREESIAMSAAMTFSSEEIDKIGQTPEVEKRFTPPLEERLAADASMGISHALHFIDGQWEVISRAIEKLRENEDDQRISGSTAIELICGDYIA